MSTKFSHILYAAGLCVPTLAATSPCASACLLSPLPTSTLISSTATTGGANRVVVSGTYAYFATTYGVEIFDISTPSSPSFVGSVATGGGSYDIALSRAGYVYLADNYSGVEIIDVNTPSSPSIVGNVTLPGDPTFGVEVDSGRLFTFSGTEGMHIYDIATNPASPSLLGTYLPLLGAYHNDGVVSGNTVYIADGVSGATVVDVSNPASPSFVADPTSGISFDTSLLGSLLVSVAPTGTYVQVHDVSTPVSNPLPTLDSDSYSNMSLDVDTAFEGSDPFAYIANNTQGCRIYSLNPPTGITLDEVIAPGGVVIGVTYHRGYVFLCRSTNGFQIWQR